MASTPVSAFTRCPECGGDNARQAARCWLCGAAIASPAAASPDLVAAVVVAEPRSPHVAPQAITAADAPGQFQLSSLFLTITVIGLCLGLLRMAPGLVVPLLVISVPALVRTFAASRRAATVGNPLTAGAKIGAFITSLIIVVLVLLAGCVAFCMACFAAFAPQLGGFGGPAAAGDRIQIMLIAGCLVALFFMAWLFIATWPKAK